MWFSARNLLILPLRAESPDRERILITAVHAGGVAWAGFHCGKPAAAGAPADTRSILTRLETSNRCRSSRATRRPACARSVCRTDGSGEVPIRETPRNSPSDGGIVSAGVRSSRTAITLGSRCRLHVADARRSDRFCRLRTLTRFLATRESAYRMASRFASRPP